MQLRKAFLWSMIVCLGSAALLGIAVIVLPQYGPEEEILGSVSLFAAFSIVALMCAVVLERQRAVALMWAGLGSATVAMLFWLMLIWFDRAMSWQVEETVIRTAGSFTVGGVLAAQCGLLSLPRFESRRVGSVRRVTIGVSMFLAVYGVILIWWLEDLAWIIDEEMLARAVGVLAIIAACGTVVTPLLWKMQSVRHTGGAGAVPLNIDVAIVCPRCHSDQRLKTGERSCARCGLRITIELEEPRCECGYLLHKLENNRCPECGRAIDERDRWAAGGE